MIWDCMLRHHHPKVSTFEELEMRLQKKYTSDPLDKKTMHIPSSGDLREHPVKRA